MIAAWQTEVGAFQQPLISGPVPAKSKTADPSSGVMVTFSWIGEPSSIQSFASSTQPSSFAVFLRRARTPSSALSRM